MERENVKFLIDLQSRLNQADRDLAMNDGQANPRFWGIRQAVLVIDKDGEPYIHDIQQMETYPLDIFIQVIDEEVRDSESISIFAIWERIDKTDAYKLVEFANKTLDKYTEVVNMREDWVLCENAVFLTKDAAEAHIKNYGHNYRKPRTYAMTALESPEFERFLKLFRCFDFNKYIVEPEMAIDANDFVAKFDLFNKQIGELERARNTFINEYYNNNAPKYDKGTILRVRFEDGTEITGMMITGFALSYETGEFRPHLFKVNKNGNIGKQIGYRWDKKLCSIESIGKGATCKNCAWRRFLNGKMYCELRVDKDKDGKFHPVEKSLNDLACSELSFVIWENHIPYFAKYNMNGKHTKTKGCYLHTDLWRIDEDGHIVGDNNIPTK